MRKTTFGEGCLAAHMVIMDLDGIPPKLVVFRGKVFGDTFAKDGEDIIIILLLRLVSVAFFFGMIIDVRLVLCEITSLPLCACCEM